MEFPYQTLKNLSEKKLKGKAQISSAALQALDEYLVERTAEILEEAAIVTEMSDKKRISEVHLQRAIVLLNKRR